MATEPDVDVAVVGAGPTGLLIAAELALSGVTVQVIERLPEPDPTVKAGSINVATAEVLDRRGLLPAARRAHRQMVQDIARFAQGTGGGGNSGDHGAAPAGDTGPAGPGAGPSPAWDLQSAGHGGPSAQAAPEFPVTGHFAGLMFRPDLVDQADPELRAHTAIAGATLVPQRDVEAILAGHAAGLGVTVRRGVEVTGLRQDSDAVVLATSAGPMTARYAVGADGGRSTVRKLAGIGFPGTDPETTGYQAIADIEGAGALRPGWNWSPTGVYSYGPVPGRILTVQFTGPPADRSAPVTLEELQASVRLVSGTGVTLTALHGTATRWTDNARQASTYRRGRILLAGDAAHVHSPFSGQGLNLGIGDAINLGWKLAATVQGWAPAGLLDTYTAERHPIGAWVLDWTRAQVALMRGDAKTRELRRIVGQLLSTCDGMTEVVTLASGIGQSYPPDGSGEAAGVGSARAAARADGARPGPVGRLVADISLADGSRLADHCHRGRFVLLDRTPGLVLSGATAPWHDRVDVVTDQKGADDRSAAAGQEDGPAGLLVRPDGVVIWSAGGSAAAGASATAAGSATAISSATAAGSATAVSSAAADGLPPSLEQALRQWAGAPAARS